LILAEFEAGSGLLYIHCRESFDLNELFRFASEGVRNVAPESADGRAIFMNLSEVSLGGVTEADLRHFIMRRMAAKDRISSPPMAVFVGDLLGLGMARMFSILSDMSGLRAEEELYASMDMDDAVAWVARTLGLSDDSALRDWIKGASERANDGSN